MVRPPSGTVTFLFTDIEGSTVLWDAHRIAMGAALSRHDAILHEVIEAHSGYVFKTVGDAFCAAFARPEDALNSAIDIQRRLGGESWPPEIGRLRARIGLHAGVAIEREDDYFGPAVNRVARIEAAAHGGQILLSQAVELLLVGELPDGVQLIDLGEHRLKGLSTAERLFQVVVAGLERDFPPVRALDPHATNLPAAEAQMFGRDKETAHLLEMLVKGSARLVTLTGPGGVGKTTVALHVAAELLPNFSDGVFQALLAPLSEPTAVPGVIAAALGVRESPDSPLADTVRDHLRQKQLLLVMDNCEHLPEASGFVGDWLSAAPGLVVLATSRAPLGLRGEQEFPILPLPSPGTAASLSALEHDAAVALFMERARAVHPNLILSQTNAPVVAAICRRLDGLPLAIELAAARTRLLPLSDLLRRLDVALPILSGGPRDAPSRQRSLRETIAWSYRLLSPGQQRLFRLLGVFRGGFSLEGVAAVAGLNSSLEALERLEPLAVQSLIQASEVDGEPRFSLLEIVREFAREELTAAGELDTVAARHLDFYAQRGREQVAVWRTGEYQRSFARMAPERDNLRAALKWALDERRPAHIAETGAWLAGDLWTFWFFGNSIGEARRTLGQAIQRVRWTGPARARALVGAGIFEWQVGGYDLAKEYLREGLAIWRTSSDARQLADAIHMMGHVEFDRQHLDAARELFAESCELYVALGEATETATLTADLGLVAMHQENFGLAEQYYQDALGIYRQGEAPEALSDVLNRMGDLRRLRGDHAGAAAYYEESLERIRPHQFKLGMAGNLHKLGQVARVTGASELARQYLLESLPLQREMSNKQGIVECLAALGGLALDEGQPEKAARLLGAADALLETLGAPLSPPDRAQFLRDEAAVRQALSEEDFRPLWEAGRGLSWDEAADEAMEV